MNKWVIVAGIVLGVILLFSFVFYITFRLLSPTIVTPTPSPQGVSVSPTPRSTRVTATSIPTPPVLTSPNVTAVPFKIHTGTGFIVPYRANWGLLTCANSPNFEFDPDNNIDQLGLVCNVATKPITVVVDSNLNNCSGQQVRLGNVTVLRAITSADSITQYQWCTQTSPVLKITHRVSATTSRAVGTVDHSREIEAMIANAQFSIN